MTGPACQWNTLPLNTRAACHWLTFQNKAGILSVYSPLSSERTELWWYYQYILHSATSLRGLNCGDIINMFCTHSASLRGLNCGAIINIFSTHLHLWEDWTVAILSIYSPLICVSEQTELWQYYQYILHSSASLRGLNCGDIINIFSTHLHLWVDWTSQYYQYSLPSSVSLRGQSCGKEAEKTPRGLKFCLVLNKSS